MMINLIIIPESIRVSKSKVSTQVFSEIYFKIGNTFFPEEKWDDFSVIILDWWLKKACNIKSDDKSVFNFMDGPYYFEVFLINGVCNISFVNDRFDRKEVVFAAEIECIDLFGLLAKNANLLIRNLPSEAEKLQDVLELKNSLKLLQNYMKSFRK
ncbi:hypothetical protein GKR55_16845 [Providencia stuartii]|uniref:hypothetical protein n=1 Tax=Providencia stuartii TaxID=588 RepID=UPI0012B60307|nr:hypothetical protein [Providencia stuartii]MCX3072392.1 hypothetical protein [Providencia stuartii]MDT2016523.1 hypothetical protein [Providencia stuartii]MDT2082762.1 hypothetical protein [Providencia stuartii]MTB82154.1 hypothetical protein [Providencia stuartii]HEM6915389.1 hypothetical protein [Providencia stuartii]